MKIDVITNLEIKFKRFRFWSDWIDVCVFDCEFQPYLLQMRVSRFNKKQFKSRKITGFVGYKQVAAGAIGNLIQMKGK